MTKSPIAAVLCRNCPWRKSSPKAGEPGGSIPEPDALTTAHACLDGHKVMQCHKSSDAKPKPCAGYLSVVGYESVGVRLAACMGTIDRADVGRSIPGLYSSLREMLKEADHLDLYDGSDRRT